MQQSVSGNDNKLGYSPQLDGLRAICILFTVTNHIAGKPFWLIGSGGVDVFFALSGFLITGILINTVPRKESLYKFYIRRFFRIAPVYYLSFVLSVLAAAVLAWVAGDAEKLNQAGKSWPQIILFCGEYIPESAGTFFSHSWTIGIEEKFYIAWPILFLFIVRKNIYQLGLLVLLFILFMNFEGDKMYEFRGYGGIALGCMAAILKFRMGWPVLNVSLATILLISAYWLTALFGVHNIIIAFAAALFVPSVYEHSKSSVSRVLSFPPLVWLGKLTFSIYMLHLLCLHVTRVGLKFLNVEGWFLEFAVAYSLSVFVAYLVYRFFEYPLIELGRRIAGKIGKKNEMRNESMQSPMTDRSK